MKTVRAFDGFMQNVICRAGIMSRYFIQYPIEWYFRLVRIAVFTGKNLLIYFKQYRAVYEDDIGFLPRWIEEVTLAHEGLVLNKGRFGCPEQFDLAAYFGRIVARR